jgi:hypothetical protein
MDPVRKVRNDTYTKDMGDVLRNEMSSVAVKKLLIRHQQIRKDHLEVGYVFLPLVGEVVPKGWRTGKGLLELVLWNIESFICFME